MSDALAEVCRLKLEREMLACRIADYAVETWSLPDDIWLEQYIDLRMNLARAEKHLKEELNASSL